MLALTALIMGLALLVWSANKFVDGSAALARIFGMPPLLIGMVIVGFGTSTPELLVSSMAAYGGNPGIALGNAYGSNIGNIALILGITALVNPILIQSQVIRKELPILAGVTLLAIFLLRDLFVSRLDAIVLLAVFMGIMGWSLFQGMRSPQDALGKEISEEQSQQASPPLGKAAARTIFGLAMLIASSRILVWGAVEIAQTLGINDLIIGLTIVAIGTSLPELASSVIAARKGEHDIALGNIIGSNLFNTLAVVGLAGLISPLSATREVLTRDLPFVMILTVSLFLMGFGFRGKQGRINRPEGVILIASYLGYTLWLTLPYGILAL